MKKIMSKMSSLIDTILCILLIIVTLSKGGFYKEDILFPALIINILGIFLAIIKVINNIRENGIISKSKMVTLLDIFVSILPVAYFMPLLFNKSISIENSIFEGIRYTNLAVIYYIIRSSRNTQIYLNVLLVIACMVGVFGIDEITYRIIENFEGIPIGYLGQNDSVISSVVQYANIASVIMIIGASISLIKVHNTNKTIFKCLYVFLQIQILLTSSRMGAALLLIGTICFSLHYIFKKEKRKVIELGLSFIFSIFCSGLISNLIESVQYNWTLIIYVSVFILPYLYELFTRLLLQIFNKKKYIITNKYIGKYVCIIIVCVGILFFILPSSLNIQSENEEVKTICKRTTVYNYGKNELYLKITPEDIYTEYTVDVYQIYEDYKPEKLLTLDKNDFTNCEYIGNFKTTNGSKFVEFVYNVQKGGINVENVKINSNEIPMSYLFLPDRLAFRLKDSFNLDLNNTLRLEYYIDALKLIKTSPIIGVGGEGFKLGYQMVQNSTYISSEVHSSPLQIAVETGIIGFVSYIVINILAIMLMVEIYKKNKEIDSYILLFIIIAINIMALFDLTMSFAIMTYILAVILGIIVNNYMYLPKSKNDEFKLDNKSGISIMAIVFLVFSIVALGGMIIYNFNIYRASMVTLPQVIEGTQEYNNKMFEKVNLLEYKLNLDKYNINYMIELDNTYSDYINLLKGMSLSAINKEEKDEINKELAKYVLRQKANVDNMIECEYYNKYALQQVASCYFNNYIRYADILSNNFENNDVAYTFYLGYAVKLTERILEIGPKNKVANQMYKNMLEVYIENLSNQNKYIKSMAIDGIIQEMKQNIAEYSSL